MTENKELNVVDTDKLNDIIMTTMAISLSAHEAVQVLTSQGFPMTVSEYRGRVANMKKKSKEELTKFIADSVGNHLERMHILKYMQRDLMRLYINTPDENINVKLRIGDRIVNLQPLISTYQEMSPFILPGKSDRPPIQINKDALKI